MLQYFCEYDDDLEFLYEKEEEFSTEIVFCIKEEHESFSNDNSFSYEESYQMMQYALINQATIIPLFKDTIFVDKYDPKVILFLYIGASASMINLDILPPNNWQKKLIIF